MSLLLDKFAVRGLNLKIAATLPIEDKDASGQASTTDSNDQGFKAKTFKVSLAIRYENESYLTELMKLAEAVATGGQRKVYLITNKTAQAFGVKQVKFTSMVTAREDDNLEQWLIEFNLKEHISNPERVARRQASGAVNQQQAPGVPVEESEQQEQLSWLERQVKKLDTWIGGNNETT